MGAVAGDKIWFWTYSEQGINKLKQYFDLLIKIMWYGVHRISLNIFG